MNNRDLTSFVLYTANNTNLTLDERERAIGDLTISSFLQKLHNRGQIDGYVRLITCLRDEVYIYGKENLAFPSSSQYQKMTGFNALEHLFNVSCGINSAIIGENEVLRQLKNAYHDSHKNETTCSELNKIFQNAIAAGKKFRSSSNINANPLSLEKIVINYIKNRLGNLDKQNILLIGTGDVNRAILWILKKENLLSRVTVTNRTHKKSVDLSKEFGINSVDFIDLYETIKKNSVIISATSAPHILINQNHICNSNSRLFVDLAVPRDIDSTVGALPGQTLLHMDDILKICENNMSNRKDLAENFEHVIDKHLNHTSTWFDYQE